MLNCKFKFLFLQSTLEQEMGEEEHESKELDEDEVMIASADKIRKIYEKADENHQVFIGLITGDTQLFQEFLIFSYIMSNTSSDHVKTLH